MWKLRFWDNNHNSSLATEMNLFETFMKKMIIAYCLLLNMVVFGDNPLPQTDYDQSKSDFIDSFIDNGFVRQMKGYKVIPIFVKKTRICIYNTSPNLVTKRVLNSFFSLLKKEFNFGSQIYVKKLESCPSDTRIYFMLRDKLNPYKSLGAEYITVFKQQGIDAKIMSRANTMAFGGLRLSKGKLVGFLTVNQMTDNISNEIVQANLKRLIIQELFQGITNGRDIEIPEKLMSILHENSSHRGVVEEIDTDLFKRSMKYNPTGLCGYDLWYLLVWDKFDKPLEFKSKFTEEFKKNYSLIIKRALEIENNPAYKSLFDPRCSGKNTGINTKIDVE